MKFGPATLSFLNNTAYTGSTSLEQTQWLHVLRSIILDQVVLTDKPNNLCLCIPEHTILTITVSFFEERNVQRYEAIMEFIDPLCTRLFEHPMTRDNKKAEDWQSVMTVRIRECALSFLTVKHAIILGNEQTDSSEDTQEERLGDARCVRYQ